MVDRAVAGDAVDPGAKLDRLGAAAQRVQRGDERLLDELLCLLAVSDDAGRIGGHALVVSGEQGSQRLVITLADGRHQGVV